MKTLLFLIISICSLSVLAEVELGSTGNYMDGFCVMSVLDLEKSTDKVRFTDRRLARADKNFLKKAETRSRKIYRNYMPFDFGDGLHIRSTAVFQTSSYDNFRRMMGAIVTVDMQGDEDEVTFYFEVDYSKELNLKLAVHDEQSASAFWICEQ